MYQVRLSQFSSTLLVESVISSLFPGIWSRILLTTHIPQNDWESNSQYVAGHFQWATLLKFREITLQETSRNIPRQSFP